MHLARERRLAPVGEPVLDRRVRVVLQPNPGTGLSWAGSERLRTVRALTSRTACCMVSLYRSVSRILVSILGGECWCLYRRRQASLRGILSRLDRGRGHNSNPILPRSPVSAGTRLSPSSRPPHVRGKRSPRRRHSPQASSSQEASVRSHYTAKQPPSASITTLH